MGKTRGTTARHFIGLAPVIALSILMVIGFVIYGIFVNGSPVLPPFSVDEALFREATPPNSFSEGAHRINFHSATLLQVLAIVVSLGFAHFIVSAHLRWKSARFHFWLRMAAVALLLVMLAAFLANPNSHSRLNVEMFDRTMKADPAFASHGDGLLFLKISVTTVCFWAALLLAGAASAVSYRILRTRTLSPIQLRKIGRTQTGILACVAGLLIAQVLLARAWEVWMVDYVPEAVQADARRFGEGIVAGIGIFGSLGLAAMYFPARAVLVSRTRIAAYLQIGKPDPKAVDRWIAEKGLQTGIAGQIGKVAILLGPAMTGGIFEVVTKLG